MCQSNGSRTSTRPTAAGFCRVRAGLGVTAFGVQVENFPPHFEHFPEHDHQDDGQEEVYTALAGSATLHAGGQTYRLEPGVFARGRAGRGAQDHHRRPAPAAARHRSDARPGLRCARVHRRGRAASRLRPGVWGGPAEPVRHALGQGRSASGGQDQRRAGRDHDGVLGVRESEPSAVRTVQPSRAWRRRRPAAMIGSMVITRPSVSGSVSAGS